MTCASHVKRQKHQPAAMVEIFMTMDPRKGMPDPHLRKEVFRSLEWLAAHVAARAAELHHRDPVAPTRFLVINGSPRSEHTCPGEMSKTYRLVDVAHTTLAAIEGDVSGVLEPQSRLFRVRPAHPSLQGLFLDFAGFLSLALLLLAQSRAGPDQRLDERNLSDVGGGTRDHDHLSGPLVPGARRP